MKVSVVIPAYNEEKFIGRCLKSLIKQDIAPDEIIVVDNNCTDKTVDIARSFGARVIREKRQGITPARNTGFNSAKNNIIARCDADTVIPKNWIKLIKNDFKNQTIDGLTGPVFFYDSKFLKSVKTYPSQIAYKSLKLFSRGKWHMTGPNMALTKEIWHKVKDKVTLDDTKVQEDSDLSINIISQGGNIGYDPNLVVGISARRLKNNPESFFIEYPTRLLNTFWINRGKLRG